MPMLLDVFPHVAMRWRASPAAWRESRLSEFDSFAQNKYMMLKDAALSGAKITAKEGCERGRWGSITLDQAQHNTHAAARCTLRVNVLTDPQQCTLILACRACDPVLCQRTDRLTEYKTNTIFLKSFEGRS